MNSLVYTLKPSIKRGMFSHLIFVSILSLIITITLIPLLYVVAIQVQDRLILNLGVIIYTISILILLSTCIFKFYSIKNTAYKIYNNKIIYENLFLSIHKITLPIEQITNIDSFESFFLDRMFKTGTLNIYTSGSSSVDLSLEYITNYKTIYTTIDSMIQHIKENEFVKKSNPNTATSNSNLQTNHKQEISTKSNIHSNTNSNVSSKLLLIKPDVKSAITLNFLQLFLFSIVFVITFMPFVIIMLIGALIQTNNWIFGIVIFFLILIFLALGVYGIIQILKRRYSKIEYHFYSNRVEYYDGFFNIVKHTIPYERITNSNSYQGILERLFNVYTINIETAGSFSSTISIKYVKNGEEINQKILEILQDAGEN